MISRLTVFNLDAYLKFVNELIRLKYLANYFSHKTNKLPVGLYPTVKYTLGKNLA